MKFSEYSFGEVTKNFDKNRVPLSSAQREKRKGTYRYFGAQGVIDYIDDYLFDGIYLLIAEDGENLKSKKSNIAQVVEGKFWVNNHAHIIQGNELCDTRYLCYLINIMDLSGYITGSTQPKLSQGNLNAVRLLLPDVDTQRKIVDYLYSLDEKISINNQINDNLEQQAKVLFKSWFVDFEVFGGLPPHNWEKTTLEAIVDFQNGYAFKSKELLDICKENTLQVFKQGHINRGGGFIYNGTKSWYPVEKAVNLQKYILKKGDILMAMTDMKDNVAILGNTAIMPVDNQYIVNQRVGHLRSNGYKGTSFAYLYLLTNSDDFLTDLRSRANSGVQVNLSSIAIKSTEVLIATEEINVQFNNIVQPMYEMVIQNQLENEKLINLRDALLPKLISGEIDVPDVQF